MCEEFKELLDMFEIVNQCEAINSDFELPNMFDCSTDPYYEVDSTDFETDPDIFDCIMRMIEFTEIISAKKERKQKRWAVHPINQMRREHGHFEKLFNEMLMYDHEKFFNYTRMNPERFYYLLELIKPFITKTAPNAIPAKCRLLITLRFLAAGDSFLSIHYNFRIGVSTAKNIIYETCEVIWNVLSPIYMKFPTEAEWLKISEDFKVKLRIPNCVGSVDGRHIIEIYAPRNSGSMYFNYLRYFSTVLLAVSDAHKNFIYVDIGAYGSQSDGGIFFHSSFGNRMDANNLNLPSPTPLPGMSTPFPYFFLDDAAFPLKENLQTPYAGTYWSLDETQLNYNNEHSSVRKGIENGFGILVKRWRIYSGPINAKPENVDSIVKATVVLHNYIKSFNDEAAIRYVREGRDELPVCLGTRFITRPTSGYKESEAAYSARDYYANYLMNSI